MKSFFILLNSQQRGVVHLEEGFGKNDNKDINNLEGKGSGSVIKNINLVSIIITALITFIITSSLFLIIYVANARNTIGIENDIDPKLVGKFNSIKSMILNEYYIPLDKNKVFEGAISGMVNSLPDPYSTYFTPEDMQDFIENSKGSYVGVGILIEPKESNVLNVIELFEESPARAAGIIKGDLIIEVDGEDVTNMKDSDEVISKIKGIEGTKVEVVVWRQTEDKKITFDIVRKKIKIKNSESRMIGDIGYLRLYHFDEEANMFFNQHLDELINKGAKGLVLDLRNNPGGSYDQVLSITDRIVPKGLIVYTMDQKGKRSEEFSDAIQLEIPLAVLTNESSASASEILAGAVRDHDKGKLIGTKTYGKGLVQTFYPSLLDGSGIKITTSEYFTPKGIAINGKGIEPDINIELQEEYKYMSIKDIPEGEDEQLNAGIEYIESILN